MSTLTKSVKLGVATLAIMNVTAVVSLRGLPAEAEYGLSSAFYYLFAALVFLIPTSFVAAELAAMFQDKQGGVFRWVGEAFGKRTGFVAIWLQWVESTIWYPTVLTFGAVSLAFIGFDSAKDMTLAANKFYTLVVVLILTGGPMMGVEQKELDAPILKNTNSLVCLTAKERQGNAVESVCIRCGKCVASCPMHLAPGLINRALRRNEVQRLSTFHVQDCMACGCCTYICPAHIPLIERIQQAKSLLETLEKGDTP